jgi:hypothetical protein
VLIGIYLGAPLLLGSGEFLLVLPPIQNLVVMPESSYRELAWGPMHSKNDLGGSFVGVEQYDS